MTWPGAGFLSGDTHGDSAKHLRLHRASRQSRYVPAPEWGRLRDYVIARRLALGYPTRAEFAKTVRGVSERTLAQVELGLPVSSNTLGVVEAALRWQPGSARAILAGGHPSPVEDGGPVPEPDPRISVKGLSAEEIEAIENMVRAMRNRGA